MKTTMKTMNMADRAEVGGDCGYSGADGGGVVWKEESAGGEVWNPEGSGMVILCVGRRARMLYQRCQRRQEHRPIAAVALRA
jgi:hypothetical protein